MNRYLIGIIFICFGIVLISLSFELKEIKQDLEPSDYHFTPQPKKYKLIINRPYLIILGILLITIGLSIIIAEYKTD